ncbi:hypothetical protein TorRG33x02_257550 [Trema orientale]|uniref:Uncharacterized protein n=1 Tax=Trema orientale TaxID=63057 RepID=A0A2P5DA86_TREOI|nr:hypothetical protein TorRG33x02_257550 [Trema orientale]
MFGTKAEKLKRAHARTTGGYRKAKRVEFWPIAKESRKLCEFLHSTEGRSDRNEPDQANRGLPVRFN